MKLFLFLILAVSLSLAGCNRQNRLGNEAYLPDNWLTINTTAWQFRELPEKNRNELVTLRSKLIEERNGRYYSFYGHLKPEVISEIKATNDRLDEAFLDLRYSSDAIFASLTPNLRGTSDTYAENKAGIAVVNNTNTRMMDDDTVRFLLLDKPSMLSPQPIVDN
jgi:hypothetical protein|tara:strand:+ start:187 stop:678 length:492 start_codon:yes stop_codon:yes gene_type:complete